MKANPEFRFEMWAATRPDDRFSSTNWDRKRKVTMVGRSRQDAFDLAKVALGDPGAHRHWVFQVVSITDHRIPEGVSRDVAS